MAKTREVRLKYWKADHTVIEIAIQCGVTSSAIYQAIESDRNIWLSVGVRKGQQVESIFHAHEYKDRVAVFNFVESRRE